MGRSNAVGFVCQVTTKDYMTQLYLVDGVEHVTSVNVGSCSQGPVSGELRVNLQG